MDSYNRKIFFSDLDGTLLNDSKQITPLTHNAIKKWMDEGHVLALSSGRPLASIIEVAKGHNLIHDNLYIIGFNGSLIYHPIDDKTLSKKVLSPELMKKIAHIALEQHIYSHAYDGDLIVSCGQTDELTFYQRTIHLQAKFINYPEELDAPSCKMLCIDLEGKDRLNKLSDKLMDTFPDKLTCLKSNDYLLEVFNKTAGKGAAVCELCNLLGISIENSYAAGDEQNDISMIEAAHTGIAMKNGRDIVKEHANVVTSSSNNEDGLLPFFCSCT